MSDAIVVIDGTEVRARTGERLLFRALDAGFYIPAVCAIRGLEPPQGSCRLCWVEVEGLGRPVTSCTVPVRDGMVVRTRSDSVDRLVRAGFHLLISAHRLDCGVCEGNRRCALQEIARRRKIPMRSARLPPIETNDPVDGSCAEMGYNPNHCILCGQCVHVCSLKGEGAVLAFVRRGLATRVGTFDDRPLAEHGCGSCLECIDVCPVGALYRRGPC